MMRSAKPTTPRRKNHTAKNSSSSPRAAAARAAPAGPGRPRYDPRDMLNLYIFGYLNRIRSSRRLMVECRRNVELFYLLNMLRPDFRTIADFRKDNRQAIKAVFRDYVKACADLNLLGKRTFAVDGTRIRASNSKKKSFTPQILEKKLDYLREQESRIEEYLQKMEQTDEEEQQYPEWKREKQAQKLHAVRRDAAREPPAPQRPCAVDDTVYLEDGKAFRIVEISGDGVRLEDADFPLLMRKESMEAFAALLRADTRNAQLLPPGPASGQAVYTEAPRDLSLPFSGDRYLDL